MDFDISEEQQLLLETVRQWILNECPLTRVRETFDGDSGHDPQLWKSLLDMGLGGTVIPEQHGGAGLDLLDLALHIHEHDFGGGAGVERVEHVAVSRTPLRLD